MATQVWRHGRPQSQAIEGDGGRIGPVQTDCGRPYTPEPGPEGCY